MGNLLINEPPLQVLPSLAAKIGLDNAIFIQQLHYWLLISDNKREGRVWVYKTFDEWQRKNFPFYSTRKLKRIVSDLQKRKLIIIKRFNKMNIDKTNWYTIDYVEFDKLEVEKLPNYEYYTQIPNEQNLVARPECQSGTSIVTDCHNAECQIVTTNNQRIHRDNIYSPDNSFDGSSEEKPRMVAMTDEHRIVIDYLNQKAGTRYEYNSTKTLTLLNTLFRKGYSVEDIKKVIDIKCKEWLPKETMRMYLRPRTLFSNKFEDYLNQEVKPQVIETKTKKTQSYEDFMLKTYGAKWRAMVDEST